MDDPLELVLGQVASGDLTPEEAEPLIELLTKGPSQGTPAADAEPMTDPAADASLGRAVRVLVQEGGRTVVNLRIPMSWTGLTSLVPGLSSGQVQQVAEALRRGERGPIVDIQDVNGDGVLISTE